MPEDTRYAMGVLSGGSAPISAPISLDCEAAPGIVIASDSGGGPWLRYVYAG